MAQLLIGSGEIFPLPELQQPSSLALLLLVVFGGLSGLLGVLYNATILRCLRGADQLANIPLIWRAGCAALLLSVLLWHWPHYTGSGEALVTQLLASQQLLGGLAILWLVRFALGPLSYSLGMSGGLFAPMLALGAVQGVLFGLLVEQFWPSLGLDVVLCGVVGMAALFAASVRAPLTGIVLIIEMTGLGYQTVSLMLACIPAAIVPFWLGKAGIYDDLRERLLG